MIICYKIVPVAHKSFRFSSNDDDDKDDSHDINDDNEDDDDNDGREKTALSDRGDELGKLCQQEKTRTSVASFKLQHQTFSSDIV